MPARRHLGPKAAHTKNRVRRKPGARLSQRLAPVRRGPRRPSPHLSPPRTSLRCDAHAQGPFMSPELTGSGADTQQQTARHRVLSLPAVHGGVPPLRGATAAASGVQAQEAVPPASPGRAALPALPSPGHFPGWKRPRLLFPSSTATAPRCVLLNPALEASRAWTAGWGGGPHPCVPRGNAV